MSSTNIETSRMGVPPAGRLLPRVAAAALPVAAFAALGWLLHAKQQWETGLIVVGFLVAVVALDRSRAGRALTLACRSEASLANTAALL
ncbi:MAG: hypothetical protein B7X76_01120, partial [Azorhizobium sp. 39-67-5]